MAELFFDDERMGIQDPRYNNQLQNESFSDLRYQDMGGVHPPLGFPRNTSNLNYNIHQDPAEDWRANNAINYSPSYPQPFAPRNMRDISGEVGEYSQIPGQGNVEMVSPKKGFSLSDFSPIAGILKALGGTRTPENQAAYDAITSSQTDKDYGTYKGNPYYIKADPKSGLDKIYSDLEYHGSNFGGKWGSQSIEQRDQKIIDRALGRLDKFKDIDDDNVHTGISTRLFNALVNRGIIDESGNRVITPSSVDEVTDRTTTWTPDAGTGGSTYTGPPTKSFNQAQFERSGGRSYSGRDDTGYGPESGNISNSPWAGAEGGRIGYANGEFVDEDINIQGPGFDVNENIEMASEGGEGDILEQLVAKYIEAGFPPEQAQAMAMQELQQMVAQSGQGEGIASLV